MQKNQTLHILELVVFDLKKEIKMQTINFNKKQYPTLIINTSFGERKISNTQLNEDLMNHDGSYVSEEARFIDESIFYFVEGEVLNIPHDKIVELINSEILGL